MPLVIEHGKQCMPCSTNFSMTEQIEILSTDTSDFLKHIIVLSFFNSVFKDQSLIIAGLFST